MKQETDDALMTRYARGDIRAFEELYDRYESRLYHFCVRQLGDVDAAADALQEVFKRVVDAAETFQARSRLESWIFTIARRICVDALRSSDRGVSEHSLDRDSVPPVSSAPSPEDRLVLEDELQRLLARLPAEQREVLLLSKYHGFTYAEIAEMRSSTAVAVRQKVYRALKTLRPHVGAVRTR
ncbi:MAG: RNA polymerase sigma factor [Gemmatimonadota bacterium]